jgi:hypothetical protein
MTEYANVIHDLEKEKRDITIFDLHVPSLSVNMPRTHLAEMMKTDILTCHFCHFNKQRLRSAKQLLEC